jgi:hypothetical protein
MEKVWNQNVNITLAWDDAGDLYVNGLNFGGVWKSTKGWTTFTDIDDVDSRSDRYYMTEQGARDWLVDYVIKKLLTTE